MTEKEIIDRVINCLTYIDIKLCACGDLTCEVSYTNDEISRDLQSIIHELKEYERTKVNAKSAHCLACNNWAGDEIGCEAGENPYELRLCPCFELIHPMNRKDTNENLVDCISDTETKPFDGSKTDKLPTICGTGKVIGRVKEKKTETYRDVH